MKIGVAQEIKPDEYRVALTPAGALELINRGHEVAIEQGAGVGSAFPDADYERVGARIVSVDEVWEGSDLVLKVKEPTNRIDPTHISNAPTGQTHSPRFQTCGSRPIAR